jgi:ATP-dependent RNA helicase SUPV3L1/SUV3
MRGLEGEFFRRASRLLECDAKDITLSEHGKLWWDGAVVASLARGSASLRPKVSILADSHLKPELHDALQMRLNGWLADRISARLEPFLALQRAVDAKPGTANALPAEARGLAHQLLESFGSLDRPSVSLPVNIGNLIRSLKVFGVWFGRRSIYLPKMLRPEAASLLALLWSIWNRLEKLPPPPQPGLTSFANDGNLPASFLAAAGCRALGHRAVRLDILDRLEEALEKGAAGGVQAEVLLPGLVSLLGCGNDDLKDVLSQLGWREIDVADSGQGSIKVWRKARDRASRRRNDRKQPAKPEVRADSPFAELAVLIRK